MSIFWIFELANNHQGSVDRAKQIIDDHSDIIAAHKIDAGFKIQLRQLDTFIHEDFQESDLKYVKRFKSTELSHDQFREIIRHIDSKGLKTIATPFDNHSLHLFDKLNIDIIKVASCSIDDWPLLRAIAKMNRRIIISTAGASFETLDKVYSLFKSAGRDFAFMHCVGEYPTDSRSANLKRIDQLRKRYPDLEIGFSTHEDPEEKTIVPLAVAKGCTIIEKHVDLSDGSANKYSCTPEDMDDHIAEALEALDAIEGEPKNEAAALASLKRGVYAFHDIPKGKVIEEVDLFYAMPCQDGQANASHVDLILGQRLNRNIPRRTPVNLTDCVSPERLGKINEFRDQALRYCKDAGHAVTPKDEIELSAHYGLESFAEHGAVIINKVNREYCKKLIVMLPGQAHPTHHHVKKEETFELLAGDCELVLNGRTIKMERGRPYVITRMVDHSFSSKQGCLVEEVSTTHFQGDSVYADPEIFKLSVDARKIYVKHPDWEEDYGI